MKVKVLYIILIISIALNLAVVGSVLYNRWTRPDFPPMGFDGPPGMMLDREQRRELRETMHGFMQRNRAMMHELSGYESELFEALYESDSVKAAALLDTIAQLRKEQSENAIKHFFEVRKNLSPEQSRALLDMIVRQRPGRHGRGPAFDRDRPGPGRRFQQDFRDARPDSERVE